MSQFTDVDVFDDSFEAMDTESQQVPIQLDSDDSFDEAIGSRNVKTHFDRSSIIEKYRKLKEESKRLDELAVEVRRLVTICKQMEECYSKRIGRKDTVASYAELRHLHDESSLLLITIRNVTNQPMTDWKLEIHPSAVFPSTSSTFSTQIINLHHMPAGMRKTFECHLTFPANLPVILELSLIREFELDANVRKVFKVDLDPCCATVWDQVQIGKGTGNTSFTSTIRLPNVLIDLLSGQPDTSVTSSQVIKSILKLDTPTNNQEQELTLCIPYSPPIQFHLKCTKDSGTSHQITIATENSRSQKLLVEHLRLRLIVEMAKLKSKPDKGINVMSSLEESSLEELFQSMVAVFF